jgi:hypothetical protein
MGRIEITCPKCNQVNVKHTGWAAVFNQQSSSVCDLCGAWLPTGNPVLDRALAPTFDRIRGGTWWRAPIWASIYLLHAFVGAGLMIIVMIPVAVSWPSFMNQPPAFRGGPIIFGAVAGLLLAERSRRRGTLLGNPRQPSGLRKE